MPTPPPEPNTDTTNTAITEFCQRLRALEEGAPRDAPTIPQLAEAGHIARSTAYSALTGKRLPSPETVRTLVTAWGGDVQQWLHHRRLIAQAQRTTAGRHRQNGSPMSDPKIRVLASFEGVLDEAADNLHYYSIAGGDDTAEVAMNRLIELLAIALQAIATDITDATDENPTITHHDVIAALRTRATELAPDSTRWYDPKSGWDEDNM